MLVFKVTLGPFHARKNAYVSPVERLIPAIIVDIRTKSKET